MHTNADLGDYLNQALPNGSPVDPGLAKRYLQIVLSFDGYTNTVVPRALDAIGHNLLRLAVVAVASINDNDNRGRTRSLPHSIDALHRALAGVTDRDVSAGLVGLQRIKDDINADRELPAACLTSGVPGLRIVGGEGRLVCRRRWVSGFACPVGAW